MFARMGYGFGQLAQTAHIPAWSAESGSWLIPA
jgi:hypothetical protein